ncbi:MAG: hypothetical protein ACTSYD_09845 [Candidatus Heimdallarchaeaceae archaeon]
MSIEIRKVRFGCIQINSQHFFSDLYILPGGKIEKRKKNLSYKIRGHTCLGPKEIEYLLSYNPEKVYIAKGIYGKLPIPEESRKLLENVTVIEGKIKDIVEKINKSCAEAENIVAILHITC